MDGQQQSWEKIHDPPVNDHRPWQMGVGRLVSTKKLSFSGSMFKIMQPSTLGNQ